MATTKKPAAKPAAKKSAAKKPAAKPAAKKPAAKKPAAKPAAKPAVKPAAKKPAAKPAIKKPETKAAAPKTTAAKTSAPKTAEKKPAAKTAAKPSPAKAASPKKTASAAVSNKLAAKKSAKPSVLQAPVDNLDPNVKYRDLFEAFTQGKLPLSQGYIVSSFFDERSAYSIYEVVSYAGVKEIYPSGDGITFVTGGRKLHILVEPATYHFKPVEPVSRAEGERIPKRFSELETIIAKNQSRIMVAKEPIETYGSFTVLRPQGINFAIIFYELPDIIQSLTAFFENSLNQQRKIPHGDAKKAAQYITSVVKSHMGFEGLYS